MAATNRDPTVLKHDFLARFGAIVDVRGLDARRGDIPFLMHELVTRAARESAVAASFLEHGHPRLDPGLVDLLLRHRYTHHTRELDRLLGIAIATSPDEYLAATPEVLAAVRVRSVEEGEGSTDAAAVDFPPIRWCWSCARSMATSRAPPSGSA